MQPLLTLLILYVHHFRVVSPQDNNVCAIFLWVLYKTHILQKKNSITSSRGVTWDCMGPFTWYCKHGWDCSFGKKCNLIHVNYLYIWHVKLCYHILIVILKLLARLLAYVCAFVVRSWNRIFLFTCLKAWN